MSWDSQIRKGLRPAPDSDLPVRHRVIAQWADASERLAPSQPTVYLPFSLHDEYVEAFRAHLTGDALKASRNWIDSPDATIRLVGESDRLSETDITDRLARLPKPLFVTAKLVGASLEIECQPLSGKPWRLEAKPVLKLLLTSQGFRADIDKFVDGITQFFGPNIPDALREFVTEWNTLKGETGA